MLVGQPLPCRVEVSTGRVDLGSPVQLAEEGVTFRASRVAGYERAELFTSRIRERWLAKWADERTKRRQDLCVIGESDCPRVAGYLKGREGEVALVEIGNHVLPGHVDL